MTSDDQAVRAKQREAVLDALMRWSIAKYRNIGIDTNCHLMYDGQWKNGDLTFNEILVPLLRSASQIRIFGFDPGWRSRIPEEVVPPWLPLLDSRMVRGGRGGKDWSISLETALLPEMRAFWFDLQVRWMASPTDLGKTIFDPGRLVIEVPAAQWPMSAWRALRSRDYWNINCVGNYFASQYRSLVSWVRKQRDTNPDHLYFVYGGLAGLQATGSPQTLERFYSELVREIGYQEPADESCDIQDGESIADCVARIVKENRL